MENIDIGFAIDIYIKCKKYKIWQMKHRNYCF